MSRTHDDYKPVETPQGSLLERCPCCGAAAEIWQYSESEDSPTQKAVMCSNGEPIGPQKIGAGLRSSGCLLYMPPEDFYRATIREAIKYWNDYAQALQRLQRTNRWETASVLRNDKKDQP